MLQGADRPWPDRQWGLCIFDDVLEHTGPVRCLVNIYLSSQFTLMNSLIKETEENNSTSVPIVASSQNCFYCVFPFRIPSSTRIFSSLNCWSVCATSSRKCGRQLSTASVSWPCSLEMRTRTYTQVCDTFTCFI